MLWSTLPSKMTSYLASSHAQHGSLISSGDAEECSATRRSHNRIDSRPESIAHTKLNKKIIGSPSRV